MAAIDDKISLLSSAPEEFLESLIQADNELALEMLKIYSRFLEGRVLTLKADELAKLDGLIIQAVANTSYKAHVDTFIPNFDVIKALNADIHKLENGINVQDVLLEADKIKNHQSVIESQLRGLPSTQIQVTDIIDGQKVTRTIPIRNASLDELIKPISDVIRQDVLLGVTFESATEAMLDAIEAGDLGLQQWAGQIARDSLSQADGLQQQTIKETFDLPFSRYVGTISSNTRPVCHELLTKKDDPVYTDKELKIVLDEYIPGGSPSSSRITYSPNGNTMTRKKGSGMIAGTDVGNFHTRRGGYNCHHSYIPISEK